MMSGESDDSGNIDPDSFDWMWAHRLWQKRGIRMEEYAEMDRNMQLAYIASELLAEEIPLAADDRLAKVYIKKK